LRLKSWHWAVLAVCAAVLAGVFYRDHQLTEGRNAFERLGCASCHMAGGAPPLDHVGSKYNRATLVEWLTDPQTIYARLGRKPLNAAYQPMPRIPASHREIEMISYFLSAQR
jgi:hypothetical protein